MSWKNKHLSEQEFCIVSWEYFRHYHCSLYVWWLILKQANFFSTYTTSGPRKFYFSVVTLFCNGILQVVLWYWATCACSYAIFQNTSSCINLDGEMYQCHIYQNSQLKKQSPRIICLSFTCNLSIPKVSRRTYISNVNMSRRVWRHVLISNVQYASPPKNASMLIN